MVCNKLPPDISMDATLFEEIWAMRPEERGSVMMYGKLITVPRYQASYGQSYFFSGVDHNAHPITHPYLNHVLKYCCAHSGLVYEQVLVNWYEDGNSYIGEHSDDEADIVSWPVPNAGIYSFSFGAERFFDIRPKKKKR
jgi:alkylated DNA repair dioxygenase AlkB